MKEGNGSMTEKGRAYEDCEIKSRMRILKADGGSLTEFGGWMTRSGDSNCGASSQTPLQSIAGCKQRFS